MTTQDKIQKILEKHHSMEVYLHGNEKPFYEIIVEAECKGYAAGLGKTFDEAINKLYSDMKKEGWV